jgi:fatty-acyl-CoA synthase
MVRGPAIARAYYKGDGDVVDEEGFFDTGDVGTIDRYGYLQITDRSKDVIKSGGEWISSIDIENLAVGHPKVAEAAVIGVRHPKWDERPLLVIVLKEGQTATREDLLGFMQGKIAKWWMPDDVVFVEEIPHTATGKIQKTVLRERFKDYVLPTAVAAE